MATLICAQHPYSPSGLITLNNAKVRTGQGHKHSEWAPGSSLEESRKGCALFLLKGTVQAVRALVCEAAFPFLFGLVPVWVQLPFLAAKGALRESPGKAGSRLVERTF